jgi:hypothetical protein
MESSIASDDIKFINAKLDMLLKAKDIAAETLNQINTKLSNSVIPAIQIIDK